MRGSSEDRIISLDLLRGIAMLAIFVTNLSGGVRAPASLLDHSAIWLKEFFVDNSFFPLFSLLFGVGFAIQLERAEAVGARFAPRYLRRCATLLLIGTAHFTLLLYNGDILRPYAIIGITLLLFRRVRPTALLVLAGASLLISLKWGSFERMGNWIQHSHGAAVAATAADSSNATDPAPRRRSRLSYTERVAQQWQASIGFAQYRDIIYEDTDPPIIFAMFLLGFYANRRGIVRDPRAHRALLIRTLVIAGGFGVVSKFVGLAVPAIRAGDLAFSSDIRRLQWFLGLGGPMLSVGYAAAGFLIVERVGARQRLIVSLANVGRMALTIYLLETFVILVPTRLSFGWRSHFTFASLTGLKLILMGVFIGLAWVWMKRFAFGPVEWLLRLATYWRWAPLSRGDSSKAHRTQAAATTV